MNETPVYVQVGAILGFVGVVFMLYRLLVEKKDATIQSLTRELGEKAEIIRLLERQTPDALAKSLSDRVGWQLAEIERLRQDESLNKEEIRQKEIEIEQVQAEVSDLIALIKDSDLLCPKCGSPLQQRVIYPIHGVVAGREVDADAEYLEYQCGLSIDHTGETKPCKNAARAGS